MTNRTKYEFTSHCRIATKTNFLMLLLFSACFAHARYRSRMIDRFLNWGDHGKPKSGKIKGRCQSPLALYVHPKNSNHSISLRNVQKNVIHVQSCCFANINRGSYMSARRYGIFHISKRPCNVVFII